MRVSQYKQQSDLAVTNLKALVNVADDFLISTTVKPSSSVEKKLKLVLLHGMCRKATSMVVLYEAGQFEGIEEIGRSIFEGYVDLENLQNDPKNYPDYLLACSEKQKVVFLNAHERQSGDLFSSEAIEKLEEAIGYPILKYKSDQESRIARICEKLPKKYVQKSQQGKLKPLSNLEQKAKWAGLESHYNGYYRLMSPHSHHDISSLVLYVMGPSAEFEWPPKKGKVPSFNSLYVAFGSIKMSTIRIMKSLKRFNGPLKARLAEIDPQFD